jgi:hypothetical protein
LGKDVVYWHEFTFYIENNTGGEIAFNPDEATIEMLDLNGTVVDTMHSYRYPSPTNRVAAGSGNRFVVGFNTLRKFDPLSVSVPYFFLRVSNYSRIKQAIWRIESPR